MGCLLKDMSCEICQKKGDTIMGFMATYGSLFCCSNHTDEEIKEVKDNMRQNYLKEWYNPNEIKKSQED